MKPAEAASNFLEQLRQAQAFSDSPVIHGTLVQQGVEWYLEQANFPKEINDAYYSSLAGKMNPDHADTIDELWDAHFGPIMQQITEAANSLLGVHIGDRRPVIGHLATGNLNAVTILVPGNPDSYLVVVEDEIITFIEFICSVVSCTIPHMSTEQDGITLALDKCKSEEWISANPKFADRFTELVLRYVIDGNLGGVQLPTTSAGHLQLSEMLTTAVDYFIVGHEFSHVILDHFDDAEICKGMLSAPDAETLAYSWKQELDADMLGAALAMVAVERHDYATGFAGIGIYFDVLNVMDRAVSLLETGIEHSRQLGTHPPASLRKQSLREGLPQLTGGDPRVAEQLETALEVTDTFTEVIDLLWDRLKPIVADLHAKGISAAYKWQTIPRELAPEHSGPFAV